MRQPGETRGAKTQKLSMRNLIRIAMVAIMAAGRYPENDEVREYVIDQGAAYNPNTFKVQCSQVRNDLFSQLEVNVNQQKVQGSNTSTEAKADVSRQLRRKQKRVARLKAA